MDLVENQGEAGGEVPEGGDSLFPQGSFQATAFKKHFHVHGIFARFNITWNIVQATLLSSIGWEGPDSFLVPEQVAILEHFRLSGYSRYFGSIDNCLYYGDGTP